MSHSDRQNEEKNSEGFIPSSQWGFNRQFFSEEIEANILDIQKKVAPCKPKIIAVTKYYGIDAIEKAYEAGIRDFGESRVIEASDKISHLSEEVRRNSKFHFIGHLQTNKAAKAVNNFDCIQSVDSLKLAETISRVACSLNKRESVLIQVNNAGEEQKTGYSVTKVREEFPTLLSLEGIEILGLMCMAPVEATEDKLHELFSGLRKLRDELEIEYNCKLPELSMGMSNDYVIAAKEGATMLRIGRKLFSNSHNN